MPRRNRAIVPKKTTVPFSCGEKRKFATEKNAEEAREVRELQSPQLSLATYNCPSCSGWHLTSKKT